MLTCTSSAPDFGGDIACYLSATTSETFGTWLMTAAHSRVRVVLAARRLPHMKPLIQFLIQPRIQSHSQPRIQPRIQPTSNPTFSPASSSAEELLTAPADTQKQRRLQLAQSRQRNPKKCSLPLAAWLLKHPPGAV